MTMKRILSAFLGFLFVFFLLLVPFKAPAESVTCEPSHWAEKSDEYETRYTLQDSTVHTPWTASCNNYNCYGYALGGYPKHKFQNIGDYCNKLNTATGYLYTSNVDGLSTIVEDDLEELDNVCILKSKFRSDAINTPTSYKVICLRISTKYGSGNDFHFMKYDRSSRVWLHKPYTSAILKYKYTPSPSRVWTNECQFQNGAVAGDIEYDSAIWYFAFSSSHDCSVQSQGDSSTHIMKCDVCGDTIRQAHVLNVTTNACKICGRSAPFTTVKSIPVNDVLPIDVLLPSSEALYNEAHRVNKDN